MAYKDVTWPSSSPIQDEMLAANGHYCGQHLGKPAQDAEHTGASGDPYWVEHNTIQAGTITQDAEDTNFPDRVWTVSYDLNGAVGTVPASQTQTEEAGSLTLSAAPTITQYPDGMDAFKEWNEKADGTGAAHAASSSFAPKKDTVLYAIYQAS